MGLVLSTKVFVHCKQLTSDDCFPFLVKGLEARTVEALVTLAFAKSASLLAVSHGPSPPLCPTGNRFLLQTALPL